MDLDENGEREELRGVEGAETVIKNTTRGEKTTFNKSGG